MSVLLSLYTPTCLQCFKGFKCSRFPDGNEVSSMHTCNIPVSWNSKVGSDM